MHDVTTGTPPMIGKALSLEEWSSYVAGYDFGSLPPNKLVLHHTFSPTVDRWRGLRSMQAMQRYYSGKNWRSAPHIYIGPEADKNIWLFTPMRDVGIHANSGNANLEYQKSWKFEDLQWYSIGVELVGNYDKVKPSGSVLAGMRAVLGGLARRLGIEPAALLRFHRDYSTKTCPGLAITRAWVLAEVADWLKPAGDGALLGPASGSAEAAIAYLAAHADASYADAAIREIVTTYQALGERAGLDWFLALAQMAHETGNLTSFWSLRPQRNPAGIGVDGSAQAGSADAEMPAGWAYNSQRGRWEKGWSFVSWSESIPAHLGRLLAYALTDAQANDYQKQLIDQALAYRGLPVQLRGCARTIHDLDQRWAVGAGYGQRVLTKRAVLALAASNHSFS